MRVGDYARWSGKWVRMNGFGSDTEKKRLLSVTDYRYRKIVQVENYLPSGGAVEVLFEGYQFKMVFGIDELEIVPAKTPPFPYNLKKGQEVICSQNGPKSNYNFKGIFLNYRPELNKPFECVMDSQDYKEGSSYDVTFFKYAWEETEFIPFTKFDVDWIDEILVDKEGEEIIVARKYKDSIIYSH